MARRHRQQPAARAVRPATAPPGPPGGHDLFQRGVVAVVRRWWCGRAHARGRWLQDLGRIQAQARLRARGRLAGCNRPFSARWAQGPWWPVARAGPRSRAVAWVRVRARLQRGAQAPVRCRYRRALGRLDLWQDCRRRRPRNLGRRWGGRLLQQCHELTREAARAPTARLTCTTGSSTPDRAGQTRSHCGGSPSRRICSRPAGTRASPA